MTYNTYIIYMYVYIHIQHYTKQHVHTCTWYATKPLQRFELLWDMLISFYHVYIYIYCIYIYNIYIQYVLCSRVQQLGLMIAGVTTSCQLHQLGRWLLQWLGDWLLGDSFSPWVSPKKKQDHLDDTWFFSHRKASNMWSNRRYVTHWSWSNMASRKLRKRPWCLRLSTGRWRRACILSCRIRGLPFR